MKNLSIAFLTFLFFTISIYSNGQAIAVNISVNNDKQELIAVSNIKNWELLMDRIDLQKHQTKENPSFLNKAKLGILYHNAAIMKMATDKKKSQELAEQSYILLTILVTEPSTRMDLLPCLKAHHASSLVMVGLGNKERQLIDQAFALFEMTINRFGGNCYFPRYLRLQMNQQLSYPNKRLAKEDCNKLIGQYDMDHNFIDKTTMIDVYLDWAKLNYTLTKKIE